jgi:hypothetical protein
LISHIAGVKLKCYVVATMFMEVGSMAAEILTLYPGPSSLAGFLRVGQQDRENLRRCIRKVFPSKDAVPDLVVIEQAKARLLRLQDSLADLQAKEGATTRSIAPPFRGQTQSVSAVLGR